MPASVMELDEYRKFTKPAELHKAINTLKGLVAGVTTDRNLSIDEANEVLHWCMLHNNLRNRHPFNELIPLIETSTEDGEITFDEAQDILWLCNNFVSDASYYDLITSSIQFLTGMIHGIMADCVIQDEEIFALKRWLEANSFLTGCYPFDEINSLIQSVLADRKIDEQEREMLMGFFGNFVNTKQSYNLKEPEINAYREKYSVEGICSFCPDITVSNKSFCFTGESNRAKRSEIQKIIASLNGAFSNNVTKKLDYLVIGSAGNPCWAYSCYGRKVEEAINLRKDGARLLIIHEFDFWDGLEDLGWRK